MKTRLLFLMLFFGMMLSAHAQVSINQEGNDPHESAMLDVSSHEKGLLIPRMSSAERQSIENPANGLMVFDISTNTFWFFSDATGSWEEMGGAIVSVLNDLLDAKTDANSIYIGQATAINDDGDNFNTVIGNQALKDNTAGSGNTTMGAAAAKDNTTGSENTSIGVGALSNNKTGNNNTALGYGAHGWSSSESSNNVAVGNRTLLMNGGSENTAVGKGAGQNSSGNASGNVFIGYEAGKEEDGSNKLYIENSASTTPLIGGDFETNEVDINGDLEVNGDAIVNETLQINGNLKISSGNPALGKVLTSDENGNASWTTSQEGASSINELSDAIYDHESIYFGEHAGQYNEAENNIALGSSALSNAINSTDNIAIGHMAGYSPALQETHGNVFIGHYAGAYNTYNNQLIIDNDNSNIPFIQGDFQTDILTINGKIRIMGGNPGSGKILSSGYDNRSEWIDPVWASEINGLSDAKADDTNIFLGQESGENSNENTYNTAIGHSSLNQNTNGTFNAALGYGALENNTTGSSNIAIGHNTLKSSITGNKNTAIGKEAMRYNTGGEKNTAIGYFAGRNSSEYSASGGVFIGHLAGYYETADNKLYIENTSSATPLIGGDFETDEVVINGTLQITGGNPGDGKVLISDANGKASWGYTAGVSKIDDLSDAKNDNSSIFLGSSGGADQGNNSNTAVGISALNSNQVGSHNTAFGKSSLLSNNSGSNNAAFGASSMELNTNGVNNTAIGSGALYNNGSGTNNTAIGFEAGFGSYGSNASGNVFLGYKAGYNETGSNKLYIDNSDTYYPLIYGDFEQNKLEINGELKITGGIPGDGKVLTSDTQGNASWKEVSAIISLEDLEDASENGSGFFLGSGAGENAESQTYNLAVGRNALAEVRSGKFNTAFGLRALHENQSGSSNVAVGYKALENTTQDDNIAIGNLAGQFSNTSNSIFIGKSAGRHSTKDNALYIDNSSTESPLIEGDFSEDRLTVNGELIVENDLIANNDVLVDGAYKYKSIQTASLQISGLEFKYSQYGNFDPYSTYITYPDGAISIYQYSEDNCYINVPVKLPKNVTIKSFRVHYKAEVSSEISIYFKSRSTSNWNIIEYASTYTFTVADNNINILNQTVNDLTIDENHIYFIDVIATPHLNNEGFSDTRIYGITVEYEFDTLNH